MSWPRLLLLSYPNILSGLHHLHLCELITRLLQPVKPNILPTTKFFRWSCREPKFFAVCSSRREPRAQNFGCWKSKFKKSTEGREGLVSRIFDLMVKGERGLLKNWHRLNWTSRHRNYCIKDFDFQNYIEKLLNTSKVQFCPYCFQLTRFITCCF